jgi:hypothetical protein
MSSSFLCGEVGVIEDCYKRVMLPIFYLLKPNAEDN